MLFNLIIVVFSSSVYIIVICYCYKINLFFLVKVDSILVLRKRICIKS